MGCNIEIKAKIDEFESIRFKLANLKPEIFKQKDFFINSNEGRLKFRQYENYKSQLIYYERDEQNYLMPSQFKIYTYPDKIKSRLALKKFKNNYGLKGVVKKTREYYRDGNVRIHLDDVQNLGKFIEIEVVVDSNTNIENAKKIAENYFHKILAIPIKQTISSSYIELILK
jgi:predicted adenylyl cyclase CyaB